MEFTNEAIPNIEKKYFSSPSRGIKKTSPITKKIIAKPIFDSTFATINSNAPKSTSFTNFNREFNFILRTFYLVTPFFKLDGNSQIYASFKFLNIFYLLIVEGIFIFNILLKKDSKKLFKET
ncbi:hypothetical protein [Kaistella sp.]|uniref:hypothetical protein n=1 Tax=Kaistella sp. TaxID=2782235 RepID=UPI00359F2C14